jgi:allantoin racemase
MKILVINPNTTPAVTDTVAEAARAAARPGTEIVPATGEFGAVVIGSRAENALAAHAVLSLVAQHAAGCDALVLAVSLDTGLWACRELLDMPVIGMTEAGLMAGCTVAARVGVLTFGARMPQLYREIAASYGLGARLAGVHALDMPAEQAYSDPDGVQAAVLGGVKQLVERDGAEAVLFAAAPMSPLAARLQHLSPVPLIDGVAAAVAMAEAMVGLKLPRAKVGSVSPTGGRAMRGVGAELSALFARKPS